MEYGPNDAFVKRAIKCEGDKVIAFTNNSEDMDLKNSINEISIYFINFRILNHLRKEFFFSTECIILGTN